MKTITLIALAFIAMESFSQTSTPNSISTDFVSAIQPATSQGYLYWKEVPNAVYKVNLYKKIDSIFIFTIGLNSTKNYLNLPSDILNGTNMYYELIAIHQLNGTTLLTGEKTPIENKYKSGEAPALGSNYKLKCYKDCDGSNYAYRISLYENLNDITNAQIILEKEAYSQDPLEVNGVFLNGTPYFQHINDADYAALPIDHPWKRYDVIGGVFQRVYKHIQISPSSFSGQLDINGNYVFSGWSIEKKPDIFSSMIGRTLNHDPTAAGPPFYGICSKPAYVWKDNMNASLDSPIQNSSTLFNDYFNIYPEQLSCDRVGWTKPPKEFTETPVTEKPSENIYYYSTFKDCIDKKNALFGSQEWWDCWNLFFDYIPSDKPYVTGIDVSPIDAKNNKYANFLMSKNKDGIYYHMRNEQVSNGLYHVAYIFNNGEIISTIDELIFADKLTPFKDLVTVNVYPNKIENNLLNFDLKA